MTSDLPPPPPPAGPGRRRFGDFGLHRRILRQARPYWGHLALLSLLSLLATPLALLLPLPLKIVVDSCLGADPLPGFLLPFVPAAVAGSREGLLWLSLVLLLLFTLLVQIQSIATSLLHTFTGQRLVLDFRARLFRHAQRLSLSYHDRRGSSDSIFRIQYDAPSIQFVAIDGIIPLVSAWFTLAGMIYVTARIHAMLALVALSVAPLLLVSSLIYQRRVRPRWRAIKELESSALSVVHEALGAMRVVKAFGREDGEQDRFESSSSAGLRARIKADAAERTFAALIGMTTAAGAAAVLYVGTKAVIADTMSLGDLLLVMAYVARLYEPLKVLAKRTATLQASLASAERAFAMLDEAPEVAEKPDARPLARCRGAVVFERVSFGYGGTLPVLSDLSLEVAPGTRVGIEGHTGAGKTTLLSLLCRFYDPTSGRIVLDGVDLRDYRLADLRSQFGIVLQDAVLFSASIAENIAYARPDASEEEIVAAAKAANAHEFVLGLEEGYATRVGERGMRLSGGERQRISLARAFLKDAPILVLDEPTSSVDVHTQAAILDALERLMRGRTTFMIAHRLDTLQRCDLRVTLDSGRIFHRSAATSGRAAATGERTNG